MIISFFEVSDKEKETFINAFSNTNNKLNFFDDTIQNVKIDNYINSDIICVFVHSKIDKNIISRLSNLKMITTRSTGTDHIDIKYAEKKKIIIKNVPLYGENTVAEHTFALILSLSRKINESYNNILKGNFSNNTITGFDLKNKTMGIIGGGRIGIHVAKIARSFGMHVRVYDIKQDEFMAEIINFKYVSLDELLETSDIISLHVPSNASTFHIINNVTLSKMKKGAILINTARGDLIKTIDLIKYLKNGKLYGAGLDVFENENEILNNSNNNSIEFSNFKKLLKLKNVVISPHNAYNSFEAINRIISTTIKNINELLKNKDTIP